MSRRRRPIDDDAEDFFDPEEALSEVASQIARLDSDLQTAQASLDHCNLQIRYWRLQQAIATEQRQAPQANTASQNCELWEKRRGQAIKDLKLDLYRELLEHITNEKQAEDEAAAFTELGDEPDERELDA